MANSSRNKG